MATELNIDPLLLEEALALSGLQTQGEAVNLALREFIQRRRQLEVLELFGTIEYEPDYDYKKRR